MTKFYCQDLVRYKKQGLVSSVKYAKVEILALIGRYGKFYTGALKL